MRIPNSCFWILLLLGLAGTASSQQQPVTPQQPAEQTPTIRVSSHLIQVPASVTDAAGNAVLDLTVDDFRLEEDGEPQSVAKIGEADETQIELVLLLDISGSVSSRFDFEREAAIRFLEKVLKPRDAVSVFAVGPNVRMLVERTSQLAQARAELSKVEPTRLATAFFDTVVSAARYVRQNAPPQARRVLVALSDGEDNFSDNYRLSDSLQEIQKADCLFYAINPSGPSIRMNKISVRGQEGMASMASQTGGTAYLPDRLEDLDRMFLRIATEIKAQYLLGYYSTNDKMDGAFRRIAVRIPKRPDLHVRARQGYYAATARSAAGPIDSILRPAGSASAAH